MAKNKVFRKMLSKVIPGTPEVPQGKGKPAKEPEIKPELKQMMAEARAQAKAMRPVPGPRITPKTPRLR